MFFFEQQDKGWSILKQAFIVSVQGSAVTQLTMCTCSTFKVADPGQESVKYEELSAPPDWTTTVKCFHCHQAGPVSGGTENVCQTTKCPKCGTQSAFRVQTKSSLGT